MFAVRNWLLTTKVVSLCMGISVVLAVGVTAISYTYVSRGLDEQGRARLQSEAFVLVDRLDHWNAERLGVSHALAKFPPIVRALEAGGSATPEDAATIEQVMTSMLAGVTDVVSVSIYNADATMVFGTNERSVGQNYRTRDYWRTAMQGRDFISGVSVTLTDGTKSIFRSVPVRADDGRVIGAVNMRSDPAAIQKMLETERDRIGDDVRGVLLDEDGLVIASSVDPDWLLRPVVELKPEVIEAMQRDKRWGKQDMPAPLGDGELAQAIGATERTAFGWRTGGGEYRAVAMRLHQTRWTYVVALPTSAFNAAASDLLRVDALAAALGLLLAGLAVALVTRAMGRALGRLTRVAEALAEGDTEQLVLIGSRDEIGRIAAAVTRMQGYQRELAASLRLWPLVT
jgi:C4-dicarboxylate-specific signal transduction histidine kinase